MVEKNKQTKHCIIDNTFC